MEELASHTWEIVTGIIGVAAIIATMTPNRSDNLVIDNICRFINLLAMNIGKSKNRSE